MTLLAAPPANTVVTGVLGFIVVAALGILLFFLLRSMNAQLRKVVSPPPWQEGQQEGQQPGGPDSPDGEPAGDQHGKTGSPAPK